MSENERKKKNQKEAKVFAESAYSINHVVEEAQFWCKISLRLQRTIPDLLEVFFLILWENVRSSVMQHKKTQLKYTHTQME